MGRAVCAADPRTLEQRRAEALGVLAHGGDRLVCGCALPGCPAGQGGALSATVVHVITEERSLADDTAVRLDGEAPPRPGPAYMYELRGVLVGRNDVCWLYHCYSALCE